MKSLLSIIFICLLSVIMTGCGQDQNQTLRVGTNIWPGYEPLYLAKEIDKLPPEVRLIEYPSASEVIRAFRNGKLEMASLTLDEVLLLASDGIPLKIVLVHDISNGADVILARPGINTMKDIVGKRVAVESTALGAYMISRAMELNKLSLSDIRIVHLDIDAHEAAYQNNQVDAVVNFEPVRTRLINQGMKEIFTSKEIYGEIVDVLIVNEESYKQNLGTIKSLINGWFDAVKFIKEKPEQASVIIAKRMQISSGEVIESYDGLDLPGREENKKLLTGNDSRIKDTINKIEKVMKENKFLNRDVDDENIIGTSAL